jgi:hypothetical protein
MGFSGFVLAAIERLVAEQEHLLSSFVYHLPESRFPYP